jgi:hypothetical protein
MTDPKGHQIQAKQSYCRQTSVCGQLDFFFIASFRAFANDPGEYRNLWDLPEFQPLKQDLLLQFMNAEMGRAPRPMPRIIGA